MKKRENKDKKTTVGTALCLVSQQMLLLDIVNGRLELENEENGRSSVSNKGPSRSTKYAFGVVLILRQVRMKNSVAHSADTHKVRVPKKEWAPMRVSSPRVGWKSTGRATGGAD